MRIFKKRVVVGSSLDKIVKDYNRNKIDEPYIRYDFYDKFFTHKEKKILSPVYMTIYENSKGKQYVSFTHHIPQPSGYWTTNYKTLIGKTTGYGTTIISCEKCYVIG